MEEKIDFKGVHKNVYFFLLYKRNKFKFFTNNIILSIIYIIMIIHLLIVSYKRKDYMSLSIICGFVMLSLSTSLYAFKPFWAIMMFVNLPRKIE